MSIVGASGFIGSQNKTDVLEEMLLSGLYWGLFGAGTAYYTLRSQPYESRLQEIFSVTDTVRGLIAGVILGAIPGIVYWNGKLDQVITNVIFASLVTGTLCSWLGYLRRRRLGPLIFLPSAIMGVLTGSGLNSIGIKIATGPNAYLYTFAYALFLGFVAPLWTRRRLSSGQPSVHVSSKQEDKNPSAPLRSPSPHRTKKGTHLKPLAPHSNRQHKVHPSKSQSSSHSSDSQKQRQPKQQLSVQKQTDHHAEQDEPLQEALQVAQSRPPFYSRTDAARGLVYGAMISSLAGAYFVNQHPHFDSGLIAITGLFGGLLAMIITGIAKFVTWWADQLENRQLGKIGLTLLELGVVLTLIQPLADLLDLVH